MNGKAVLICISLLFPAIISSAQTLLHGENDHEEFMYEIRYGWIKIGEARLSQRIDHPVITLDVLAYTTGVVDWIARLKDSIHTVIDAETFKPIRSYMDRREGKYHRKQEDFFDFDQDSVTIKVFRRKRRKDAVTQSMKFFLRDSTYDMLSSYAYLRSRSLENFHPGDSVMLNMFYEDKYYPFGVEYLGKEELTTNIGTHTCHIAYILFPISDTFPEKYMVKVWVTVDQRKLPVLVEARMKFGKAVCELVNVR